MNGSMLTNQGPNAKLYIQLKLWEESTWETELTFISK